MNNKQRKYQKGYSLVEMVLAMGIGSFIIAALYNSYGTVLDQYRKIESWHEIQSNGIPTLRIISRDIRMAGRKAVDANIESPIGLIASPITILDSVNVCCDQVTVMYDKDVATRYRIRYYTSVNNNPTRNTLYMDRDLWNTGSSSWDVDVDQAIVADYLDDFQVVGSDLNLDGDPQLVDISVIVRSRKQSKDNVAYAKPTYDLGNYNFTANDGFQRDEFNVTINLKNLRN